MDLLASLGILFLIGLLLGKCAEKLGLPPLVGYLFTGIFLSPLLGEELRQISPSLRKIALVMILLKAGLTLAVDRLKKVGRPAVLLSFLPALCEILACTLIAPLLFPLNTLEAMLLGTVLAAVSPAVVVPRMVSFMERGLGRKRQVPELVLAGASLDDVFVMVLFTCCLDMVAEGVFSWISLLNLPISVVLGLGVGCLLGKTLSKWKFFLNLATEAQILFLLGCSFLLVSLEEHLPFSGLLAVMTLALNLKIGEKKHLSDGFTSLWKGAEVMLFALVGAEVAVEYALQAGVMAVVLVIFGLIFRSFGSYFATFGTELTGNERKFVVISYLPKATVQAGIGGIPLAMGLDCGELLLTLSVLAILLTAPFGAWLMDRYGAKLLEESV